LGIGGGRKKGFILIGIPKKKFEGEMGGIGVLWKD
jgi:hypothetical protein